MFCLLNIAVGHRKWHNCEVFADDVTGFSDWDRLQLNGGTSSLCYHLCSRTKHRGTCCARTRLDIAHGFQRSDPNLCVPRPRPRRMKGAALAILSHADKWVPGGVLRGEMHLSKHVSQ